MQVTADTAEMVNPADVSILAGRDTDQGCFFIVKTVRKITGINESLEYTRKTAVVLRYDEEEFAGLADHFLNSFKFSTAFTIQIRSDEGGG